MLVAVAKVRPSAIQAPVQCTLHLRVRDQTIATTYTHRDLLLRALEALSPVTAVALYDCFGCDSEVSTVSDPSYFSQAGPEQQQMYPSDLMRAAGAALAHAVFKAPPAYRDLLGPFAGPGGRSGHNVDCVRAQFARAAARSMAQVGFVHVLICVWVAPGNDAVSETISIVDQQLNN